MAYDLHHNLNTSYCSFGQYIKKHNLQLYELLRKYVDVPETEKDLYSDFENNLAHLNIDKIINEYSWLLPNIPSEEFKPRDMHKFPDQLLNVCETLTVDLIIEFEAFIRVVEYKPSSKKKNHFELDAGFLCFNYTKTLEE